ncbi:MAG: class I SAM-dependent methyltransferase [Candidatus Pacebacteria bacterium]|nr:class I SAM-dependent methyltransferase [Candidatus Paceibacterota bacterium]
METESMTCLLCQSKEVDVLTHNMCRCRTCGYFFVTPAERERQQANFQVVTDAPVDTAGLAHLKKKYPKDGHGKRKLYEGYAKRAIAWYGTDITVLDVGASGGFFLHEVEKLGVKPANLRTLEVDRTYQALTEEYFGYEGVITNIETYVSDRQYHFITLFDVLEHVHKFWDALGTMHDALTPDGRLLLKLPNARWAYLKYRTAMLLGWSHKVPGYLYLEPGGHLNYWNNESIKKLEKAGFELESFVYVYPHKEQFGKQHIFRIFGYKLNALFGLNLFPEFIAVFKKK